MFAMNNGLEFRRLERNKWGEKVLGSACCLFVF